MPQRHDQKHRKRQAAAQRPEPHNAAYCDFLARELVRRGLASKHVLSAGWRDPAGSAQDRLDRLTEELRA